MTLHETPDLGVLRFITAGSVDDGKSTLIGRMLLDSRAVLSDQLSALARVKHKRTASEELDLSLLTDGLEAEREQGITIDVAYRYFATARRKFIIADTPGHEQYTRNMVTGASTADAAVILIDATRVSDDGQRVDLLPQTKRHSAIVKLLGLPHVIVAVNKMDLVGYDAACYRRICEAYGALAARLGIAGVRFVPVSALKGDNIVTVSERMPWYTGAPLLEILEVLPMDRRRDAGLRFPVQRVARQDGITADDFRGYMGRIESGSLAVSQWVNILPAGTAATIAEIIAPVAGGTASVDRAVAGQCVTVRLSEDVDVSRGDMFVAGGDDTVTLVKRLQADICWFDSTPLSLQRKYWLKQTTSTVFARVTEVERVLDVQSLSRETGRRALAMNDIGTVSLTLQRPIVADAYAENPATGAFVLIDETTHQTVGAGIVRAHAE